MAPLEVTTVAGSDEEGHHDGQGTAGAAKFNEPEGLTFDSAGNLVVCDSHNHCIIEPLHHASKSLKQNRHHSFNN